jgi:hypothetical protein
VGRHAIQAEGRRGEHAIESKPIINGAGYMWKGEVKVDE